MINPTIAYAYLDPGTGSNTCKQLLDYCCYITAISVYWVKFKSIISRIFLRKKKENLIKIS